VGTSSNSIGRYYEHKDRGFFRTLSITMCVYLYLIIIIIIIIIISTNNIAIGLVRVRKIRFRPTKNTLLFGYNIYKNCHR
jgi:hypothetical protein